jgi:hypothetical protein
VVHRPKVQGALPSRARSSGPSFVAFFRSKKNSKKRKALPEAGTSATGLMRHAKSTKGETMESTTITSKEGVGGGRATLALILAILSVPGSTAAWSLWEDGGGFVIGMPLAFAAIVIGLRARQGDEGRGKATAAIVIAGVMVAMTVVWTAVEVLG